MHSAELSKTILKLQREIFEMSRSSYSQSNPSYVLSLRTLRRQRDHLIQEWKKSRQKDKPEPDGSK
jgi:hypothetical protein